MMHILANSEVIGLPKNGVITIDLQDPSHHMYAYDILNKSDASAVCVSFAKPAYITEKYRQKMDANPNRHVHLIDTVTIPLQMQKRMKNATYVSHIKNLQEVAQSIEQAVLRLPAGEKHVLFDNIHTLALHHTTETVQRFLDFMVKRLKLLGASTTFIVHKERMKEPIKQLMYKLSDKTIRLE